MEINKLIEKLTERAHLAAMNEDNADAGLFEKSAETIKLLYEIARDTTNAEYKKMIREES